LQRLAFSLCKRPERIDAASDVLDLRPSVGARAIISGMEIERRKLHSSAQLVLFFSVEGGASIMFAIEHHRQFSTRWAFMFASGVVDIVLARIDVRKCAAHFR
jgi:hypothetical protein